jgi:succinate-semialdehyde dehydrogenase/glutarate-semialdehyde dehydrogenase
VTVSLTGDELHPVDPATLEPLGPVAATPPDALAEAVAEASLAQARWARTSLRERRTVLGRVARYALDRADEIALTISTETGKPVVEAYVQEVFLALDNLMWTAGAVEGALADERIPFPQPYLRHKKGWILREPLGVVAVISPWNFPFSIPFTQAAMAVAAGNAVVVKPAELTPRSGEWVERCFDEAGAPEGLVRVVQGEGETVGAALVRTHGVAKVFFTGSAEAGRAIAAAAGSELRPVVLELGGKDPLLVFEDADLDRAVRGALWGSFSNCGQVCSGVERIYVARSLHDEFVSELARQAQALRIGRGAALTTDLGPLVSEEGRTKVERLLADAVEHGARVVTGGGRPRVGLPGWFHQPTVLTHVPKEAAIEREEVFGPLVSVAPFRTEDEAVRLANDSPYGLGASVWTADAERAARVARRLEAGSVWTNDVAYSYGAGQAPWGGRKGSGFGRTHSRYGFQELTHLKFVDADSGRVPVPWWFPYGPRALDGFQGVAGVLFGDGLVPRAAAAIRHGRGLAHLARRYLAR